MNIYAYQLILFFNKQKKDGSVRFGSLLFSKWLGRVYLERTKGENRASAR